MLAPIARPFGPRGPGLNSGGRRLNIFQQEQFGPNKLLWPLRLIWLFQDVPAPHAVTLEFDPHMLLLSLNKLYWTFQAVTL